ncbi:enoyl-ACP reductase FabV [Vagococcus fluvialis]|uniref:enoyl-ACP reductase FabV n=1 Tax=Vagococcus fluvialis TaxID=2738 RepID=UPI003D0AAD8A
MKLEMKLKNNAARSVNPYGCKQEVLNQINYVKEQGSYEGPKKVLVLGSSSSYGLASRITAAFGAHADTIGVSFERGPKDETMLGTAGWYNNIFFREFAEKEGLIAKNFIGDAYSLEMKETVINYIKEEFGGKIDLLVYSLAAPKRTDYKTGITYTSALKPIGKTVTGENINLEKEELFTQVVEPATEEEIEGTVKVMGGEDWEWWVELLKEEGLLAEGFKTTLYSYIGPKATHAFYHEGSLGVAKKQAEESSNRINKSLKELNGESLICVSKAVTTKASVVIPILPKYLICLYKVMLEKGTHETPIMHKDRIFRTMFYGEEREFDDKGRLRPDSWELNEEVQQEVSALMEQLTPENFKTDLTAYKLFRKEFLNINGFEVDGNTIDEANFEDLQKMKP